jgi:adenylate cyclase
MQLQPAFFLKVRQVLIITIAWIIANIIVELNNSINYDPETRTYFFHFIFGKNAFQHLLITAIGPLAGGLFAGSFIVFYQREKVKGRSYREKLFIHSSLYIFYLMVFIGGVGILGALNNTADAPFWVKFREDVFSLRVLRLIFTWYFIVVMTVFFLDVNEKYGAGILRGLLLGKYHKPGKEERVFMFLDLKGSTTIAEQIGDEKYFSMLRYFYQVANEAIINTYGEIYQYVGDEIVISWEKKEGIRNANCLRCFTAIQEAVKKRAGHFTDTYGVVPAFKAGIHAGTVTTGEIGTIKKDIVYSGDVLNTTARIVALCNFYKEELLISGLLYQELKETTTEYNFYFIENVLLRGKKTEMGLWGVRLENALATKTIIS